MPEVPRSAHTNHPLSPTQRDILFEYLLGERPGVHIEQIQVSLSEALDIEAFERALKRLIATPLAQCRPWVGFTLKDLFVGLTLKTSPKRSSNVIAFNRQNPIWVCAVVVVG